MTTYKNPYPTVFPRLILGLLDKITSQVTKLVARFSSSPKFITRVLTNFLLLAILAPLLIVFIESQTGVLFLERIYTTPISYIGAVFIIYSLTHRQLAPINITDVHTKKEPTLGYPIPLLLLLGGFLTTVIANHLFSQKSYALVSIIFFVVILYFYLKRVFVLDSKTSNMDAYRFEKWMPLTNGIGYAYVLAILFYSGSIITILGVGFVCTTLLFYRFRTKRYNESYTYTLDDFYDREDVSEDEVVETIQTLQQTGAIQNSTEEVLEEYSSEAQNVISGDLHMEKFVQQITSGSSRKMLQNVDVSSERSESQTVGEIVEEEQIQDIIWSWAECKEEVERYFDEEFPDSSTLELQSWTYDDIKEIQDEIQEFEDAIDSNSSAPRQATITIQRLQKNLDAVLSQFEQSR